MIINGVITEKGLIIEIPSGKWAGRFYFDNLDAKYILIRENGFSLLESSPDRLFNGESIYPLTLFLSSEKAHSILSDV